MCRTADFNNQDVFFCNNVVTQEVLKPSRNGFMSFMPFPWLDTLTLTLTDCPLGEKKKRMLGVDLYVCKWVVTHVWYAYLWKWWMLMDKSEKKWHFNVNNNIFEPWQFSLSLYPWIITHTIVQHHGDAGSCCKNYKVCAGEIAGKPWHLFGSSTDDIIISVPAVYWVFSDTMLPIQICFGYYDTGQSYQSLRMWQ